MYVVMYVAILYKCMCLCVHKYVCLYIYAWLFLYIQYVAILYVCAYLYLCMYVCTLYNVCIYCMQGTYLCASVHVCIYASDTSKALFSILIKACGFCITRLLTRLQAGLRHHHTLPLTTSNQCSWLDCAFDYDFTHIDHQLGIMIMTP